MRLLGKYPLIKFSFILRCSLLLFFICNLVVCIFVNTRYLDNTKQSTKQNFLYLPSGKFLKATTLSYDEMLADLLWIKAIGIYGTKSLTKQDFEWLTHILEITTTLNPYFQYPYEFGGLVLADAFKDIDGSTAILKKGMVNVPETHKRYWYFPFFIAFNYMFYKNDYKTAAHYLEIAAKFPQSPSYLPLLTARLYANANTPEIAIPFLQEMIKSTDSEELKKQLIERLNQIIIERNILVLEKAKKAFYKKNKKMPKTIQEFLKYGIIKTMPENPLGGRYYISEDDHSVKHTDLKERMPLYINNKK